jgi:hypothetical protein
MRPLLNLIFIGALALGPVLPTTVFADQAFHSQRLSFSLTPEGQATGHPVLRSGQVVDIHADGPQIGAIERYMINGAKPHTNYAVVLELFDGDCAGADLGTLMTTTLTTNKQGNAHGGVVFTAEDLVPFSGLVFGILWTLVDENDVVAYETPCIVVPVD